MISSYFNGHGIKIPSFNYKCELDHLIEDWLLDSNIKHVVVGFIKENKIQFNFKMTQNISEFYNVPFIKLYGLVLFAIKLIYGIIDDQR